MLITALTHLLIATGGIFSVALSVRRSSPTGCLPVRKYAALCCPDFPPPARWEAIGRLALAKIVNFREECVKVRRREMFSLSFIFVFSFPPMFKVPYIDFHTHKPVAEGIAIENLRATETKGIRNATYFSVGIHPWDMHHQDLDTQWAYVRHMAENAQVLTIGESGLDRNAEAPLDVQAVWFERHCQLAEALQKPLVIHCVRAFTELMQIRKERKPTVPWIIHGFNANPEIARQLRKYDFYFSLGSALLRSESNASQLLKTLPEDRFFLETDDKDVSIQAVYQAASERLHKPEHLLKQEVFARFQILFSRDFT